ncbi:glycosyltransferase, partial [Clostridiaceae bacterium OttesenSCG-928-D20]|nr:glycosyltransferase [Clostridiaceae bacterium OttesenSCG-928-D20]
PGYEISVVCGNNKSLQKKLSRRYEGNGSIHILGFVTDMPALLDSADLYLTKPGGISTTESAMKDIPMIFIDAVSGCEKYNLNFFESKSCAVSSSDIKELSRICIEYLKNDEKRKELERNLQRREKTDASGIIYQYMKENRDYEISRSSQRLQALAN